MVIELLALGPGLAICLGLNVRLCLTVGQKKGERMRSKKQLAYVFLGLLALLALSQVAVADTTLNDWCVNNGGDISSACNGAGAGGGTTGINMSGFDTTFSPNALGSIAVTASTGGYASFYADYDLGTLGSFQDSASVHGALPTGWSFEIDDPNTSNIFNLFASNQLTNTNHVGTASGPPGACCDVAFALSISGLNAGEVVVFTVSKDQPAAGFYIEQTNVDGETIYLSAMVENGTPSPVPEPSTLLLGALGSLGVLMWRRFCAA